MFKILILCLNAFDFMTLKNVMLLYEILSLVGIAKSEDISKDAEFLDEIKKVLDKYETSEQFITARNQIENTYKAARASLKKRIREEKQ